MIKARHHWVINPLFEWLTRVLIRRHFHAVHIHGESLCPKGSVLMIANHIGWWDGFWMNYLNQQLSRRAFYFMMSEEQLRKHWYFRYAGGYSVRKGNRSVVESLQYTVDLLRDPSHLVLLFPQGKIGSAYLDRLHFQKGVQRIMNQVDETTNLLFVASFTDYLSEAKPHLYLYTRLYKASCFKNRSLEVEYNCFYREALNQQQQIES